MVNGGLRIISVHFRWLNRRGLKNQPTFRTDGKTDNRRGESRQIPSLLNHCFHTGITQKTSSFHFPLFRYFQTGISTHYLRMLIETLCKPLEPQHIPCPQPSPCSILPAVQNNLTTNTVFCHELVHIVLETLKPRLVQHDIEPLSFFVAGPSKLIVSHIIIAHDEE